MKRFVINEIDRDYNQWVRSFVMGFASQKEADVYCKEQTWTGHYYYAMEIEDEPRANTVD